MPLFGSSARAYQSSAPEEENGIESNCMENGGSFSFDPLHCPTSPSMIGGRVGDIYPTASFTQRMKPEYPIRMENSARISPEASPSQQYSPLSSPYTQQHATVTSVPLSVQYSHGGISQ